MPAREEIHMGANNVARAGPFLERARLSFPSLDQTAYSLDIFPVFG